MGNRWEIATYPIMEWMATFHSPPPADWFRTVLGAGWELDIYWADPGDLTRPHTTATRLAVVDARGAVVERWVSDLANVVREALYHPDLPNHVKHKPPLSIMALEHAPWELVVTSYSDIWLPWSEQRHDPGFMSGRWTDNRELATRHTPRLNEFLARLRETALDLGGAWDVEWADLGRRRQFQFDEHGVRLDAENRMTHDKHVWLEGRTLTEGLRHVLLYPPPGCRGTAKRRAAGWRNSAGG